MFHIQDVFVAGVGGYEQVHVPGMIVTPKGSVLVYGECRRQFEFGDWAPTDAVIRRSCDGGNKWDSPKVMASDGDHTMNNPVAIADPVRGRVHFLHCIDYARVFYTYSDDDCETFQPFVEITAAFEDLRKEHDWNVVATGPGHGICLRNGRLVVPIWIGHGELVNNGHPIARHHSMSCSGTIYSDDGGATWHSGGLAARDKAETKNPNETCAVELEDGRVMLNIRSQSMRRRKLVSISATGSGDWSEPVYDEGLFEPSCMASVVRVPSGPDQGALLFTNPNSKDIPTIERNGKQYYKRENLTVRLSRDGGKTWSLSKVIDRGPAGYSDLAVGPDGTIYCFYARGNRVTPTHTGITSLSLVRFDHDWLHS